MAFVTNHHPVRKYHRRELGMTLAAGELLSCSLYCDMEQPEETMAPFWSLEAPVSKASGEFTKIVSLDWTALEGHIDPAEAGSETVRGGFVWLAARMTAKFAAEWLRRRRDSTVLELGAGTGVVGMMVAPLSDRVVCTDGNPAMLQLLQLNAAVNGHRNVSIAKLLWGGALTPITDQPPVPASFDLVVASDLLYSEDDVVPLWTSVNAYLSEGLDAAFLLGHQERHTTVFHRGMVGESEEDEVLQKFMAEAAVRSFQVERIPMTSLVEDEELVHLLLCTRARGGR